MIRYFRSTVCRVGAALVLTAGLAAGVLAQGRPGPGPRGPIGPGGFPGAGPGGLPLGQLDLSEAQRSQIRDVIQRYQQEMQDAAEHVRSAQEVQRRAVETVPLNEGLVRSTSDALAEAETDVALVQARIHNDVYAVLTPDQQAKAKSLEVERDARLKQRLQQFQQRQQRQRPRA